MRVVVTGATGFVGTVLVPALRARGAEVTVLSRDAARAKAKLGDVTAITADLETPGAWGDALAGADAVVHLAGEPIAGKRWDARQKQIVRDSRVEATRGLVESIAKLPDDKRPGVIVSASGTDYYPFAIAGEFGDDEVTEKDPVGDSFLARVCRDWEEEANAAAKSGVRVVTMRTGLVLGKGGALAKMTGPFRWFVGGPIGSGKQWVSWIHVDDVVAAYIEAVHDERYRGAMNLVTDSVQHRDLAHAIGHALGRPSFARVPGFAIKVALGELAPYLLNGRRVVPGRLRELGFRWKHAKLEPAVTDALGR